ncbi:guanine deaminase [Marinobacterium sp. YM272]|uniref:guanine deaminase n=1 Tax=Marinobacterium sp. YM272 TaxID=3421654 RepID=UPI003D7F3339
MSQQQKAIRGAILDFIDDPALRADQAWRYIEDGILWLENGRVKKTGSYDELFAELPESIELHEYTHHLILPGFIDTHIHYPQTEMIAAYGERLLEWLETYTFPVESKFGDEDYGHEIAAVFLDELLKNGTTTALVFGTVHPASVDAFFSEAQQRRLRMIAGKVMMDRNAPDFICDEAEQSYTDSRALIERWHGVDRLQYAVTPRFAPTSSDRQLELAGKLLQEYPDVYMHTHLAENVEECAWVAELFPRSKHYLDVYDQAGLLSERSVFAHGIHLCDEACDRLSTTGSAIAHCPTSNLFLGSGLFELDRLSEKGVQVGVGTDVGGGTSFSMFETLADAYKVQAMRGKKLDPFRALYLATLGGARALDLEGTIGNFEPGCEADFICIDLHATPFLKFRTERCRSLFETLFVLNTLGDDRLIDTTWVMGEIAHRRES